MRAVTYIDVNQDFKTYRFKLLRENGITPDLVERLKYAVTMIDSLLAPTSSTQPGTTTTKSGPDENNDEAPLSSAVKKATVAGTTAAAKALNAVNRPHR